MFINFVNENRAKTAYIINLTHSHKMKNQTSVFLQQQYAAVS